METGFFRLLWRFNAIAIAAAALLMLAFGSVIGFGLLFDRKTTRVVSADPADQSVETILRYGGPQRMSGSVLRIPLIKDQTYTYRLASKGSRSNTINFAFVKIDSGETSWLLTDNRALVLSHHIIARTDEQDRRAPLAIVYAIVRADTSGDGFLSASDDVEIAVGLPDNSRFEVLVSGAKTLKWADRAGEDRAMIVFADAEGSKLAWLSISDLSVTTVAPLIGPSSD